MCVCVCVYGEKEREGRGSELANVRGRRSERNMFIYELYACVCGRLGTRRFTRMHKHVVHAYAWCFAFARRLA